MNQLLMVIGMVREGGRITSVVCAYVPAAAVVGAFSGECSKPVFAVAVPTLIDMDTREVTDEDQPCR